MKKQSLVSVIIPCYNVGRYLERCIQSLITAPYENKELIFINDGSTDGTKEILDDYACRFNFIHVIHKMNGGVSSARNEGLNWAKGKYVMFADPDDYVSYDFFETAVAEIESSNCDMLLFGFNCDWTGKFEPSLPLKLYELSNNEEIMAEFFPRIYGIHIDNFCNWLGGADLQPDKETGQLWRWIYKRSLIEDNGIRFRNMRVGEDVVFNCDCLLCAKSMKSINNCLYNYFPRKEGLMYSNVNGLNSYHNKIDILRERARIGNEYSKKYGKEALPLYAGSCIMSCFELGYLLSKSGGYTEYLNYVKNPIVQDSIKLGSLQFGNIKGLIPFMLLKCKAYSLLFNLFRIMHKFNIKAAY